MGTHIWNWRVDMGIFGVYFLDTYNVTTQSITYEETYHVLLFALAEDMVDNNLYLRPTILPSNRTGRSPYLLEPVSKLNGLSVL